MGFLNDKVNIHSRKMPPKVKLPTTALMKIICQHPLLISAKYKRDKYKGCVHVNNFSNIRRLGDAYKGGCMFLKDTDLQK